MGTQEDLKRCAQASAAVAGAVAARAKEMADQLFGNRERARQEAVHKAEAIVHEGRHAAADIVSALRREASAMLRDLEHLEQVLRNETAGEATDGGGAAAPSSAPRAAAATGRAAARPARARAARATKAAAAPSKRASKQAGPADNARPKAPRATRARKNGSGGSTTSGRS